MSIEKKRIDYLDIAKAIAIFLVMMGHTGSPDTMFLYRRIIYSFHMPLFFLISGIITERRQTYSADTWKTTIKKNAYALLIPYFFWALLYSKFSYTAVIQIIYGSWKTINDSGSVLALWFPVCLFAARLEMEGILALSKKIKMNDRLFAALVSPAAFAVGFLLPKPDIGYPWQFNISFAALGFLLLGYALRPLSDSLSKKGVLPHILFTVISGSLFTAGILYKGESLELIMMLKLQVGNPILFFWLALTGSAAILGFSMFIEKIFRKRAKSRLYNGLLWVGKNTMAILVLHKPFLPEVVIPLLIKLGMGESSILTSVTGSLITLVLCIPVTILIKKYCPALLGLKPVKNVSLSDSRKSKQA